MLKLDYKFNTVIINPEVTPLWADKVKRWSQLDQASYVLAEATHANLDFFKESFDQLIVVSTQGSSKTDMKFVTDTKISPSHFVHTLPNVRTIVFSLLTGWEGEMFCLTKGQQSLVNFLKNAPVVDQNKSTVVISMNTVNGVNHCDFYKIGLNLESFGFEFIPTENLQNRMLVHDLNFKDMLLSESVIALSSEVSLRKAH